MKRLWWVVGGCDLAASIVRVVALRAPRGPIEPSIKKQIPTATAGYTSGSALVVTARADIPYNLLSNSRRAPAKAKAGRRTGYQKATDLNADPASWQ